MLGACAGACGKSDTEVKEEVIEVQEPQEEVVEEVVEELKPDIADAIDKSISDTEIEKQEQEESDFERKYEYAVMSAFGEYGIRFQNPKEFSSKLADTDKKHVVGPYYEITGVADFTIDDVLYEAQPYTCVEVTDMGDVHIFKESELHYHCIYLAIGDKVILDEMNESSEVSNESEDDVPVSVKNAIESGLSYLDCMSFSFSGLVNQLEYDGYSEEDATMAVVAIQDAGKVDWNEQAVLCAQSYLDCMSFSYSGLVDQLLYDGFTQDQAEYGVSQAYK